MSESQLHQSTGPEKTALEEIRGNCSRPGLSFAAVDWTWWNPQSAQQRPHTLWNERETEKTKLARGVTTTYQLITTVVMLQDG